MALLKELSWASLDKETRLTKVQSFHTKVEVGTHRVIQAIRKPWETTGKLAARKYFIITMTCIRLMVMDKCTAPRHLVAGPRQRRRCKIFAILLHCSSSHKEKKDSQERQLAKIAEFIGESEVRSSNQESEVFVYLANRDQRC